jgi:TonB family protein
VRQWLIPVFLLCVGLPSLTGNPYAVSQEEGSSTRRILNRVVPQYPELAHSMHIEGTVKLLVIVAPNGKPTSTQVMGGHPLLAKSSVGAVEKWKWISAPEETKEVVELHFHPD